MSCPFSFVLPDELVAKEPPEVRGAARNRVRLLVIDRRNYSVTHTRFDKIGEQLRAGDMLVFNASRTLPTGIGWLCCCAARAIRLPAGCART